MREAQCIRVGKGSPTVIIRSQQELLFVDRIESTLVGEAHVTESRRAARLIALDSKSRLLLFQYARPNGERFWATPGGGVEGTETFEAAAAREAREELGVEGVELDPLWESSNEFVWGDRRIRQQEHYFLVRLEPQDYFLSSVSAAHHLEGILAVRWWPLAELETTKDLVFPEELASRIRMATTCRPLFRPYFFFD